jgi:hypothetical protein
VTEIYRFDAENGRYQLAETIPDPDDHPYYLVLDAHAALSQNDPDRAYDLATNALAHIAAFRNDAREFMFLDDWSVPRIAGLAHLQRMMVSRPQRRHVGHAHRAGHHHPLRRAHLCRSRPNLY